MAAALQPPPFSCLSVSDGARTIIASQGELDISTCELLQTRIDEAIAARARSLVLDLSGLTFVDSSGLHCLLSTSSRARRDGIELEIVPPGAGVMRIFELTATAAVLPFRSAA